MKSCTKPNGSRTLSHLNFQPKNSQTSLFCPTSSLTANFSTYRASSSRNSRIKSRTTARTPRSMPTTTLLVGLSATQNSKSLSSWVSSEKSTKISKIIRRSPQAYTVMTSRSTLTPSTLMVMARLTRTSSSSPLSAKRPCSTYTCSKLASISSVNTAITSRSTS